MDSEEGGSETDLGSNFQGTAADEPDKVRLFLDEHINPDVVPYLRAHAIDVLTAYEANRANQRISDSDQLTFATSQGRVLVSRDKHFLNPREVPQLATGQHVGIISMRRMVGIGDQARFLRFTAILRKVGLAGSEPALSGATVGAARQFNLLQICSIAETETASSMQGRIRFYEPIPRGMFPDDQ